MSDRQNGGVRGRGTAGRGRTRMRMDDPAFNPGKRKREEEGDPVLYLLSLVLRIGDRLRVRCLKEWFQARTASTESLFATDPRKTLAQSMKRSMRWLSAPGEMWPVDLSR